MPGRGRDAAGCAPGEEQVGREARVETRIRDRAGIGAGHGCVTACVRKQQREAGTGAALRLPLLRECSTDGRSSDAGVATLTPGSFSHESRKCPRT